MVVFIRVSVAAAVVPLAVGLLIPPTAALVQEKLVPSSEEVAVYVVGTFVHRVEVISLVNIGVGLTVMVLVAKVVSQEPPVVVKYKMMEPDSEAPAV